MPLKTAAFLTNLLRPPEVLNCNQQFFLLLNLLLTPLLYDFLHNRIVLGIPSAMFSKPSIIQRKTTKEEVI
jgi:hypothetical protein